MKRSKKGTPRAGAGGGSIEFSSAVTRSGDWSDSMSDDSESEMLMLEKSSSGGSGSDSGSALPLDSIDAGALTLDALDRTKAMAANKAPATACVPTATDSRTVDRQSRPSAPDSAAGERKGAAGSSTLGRVLAATQAYTQGNGEADRKKFLAGLGDEEEQGGSSPSSAPPIPLRKTAAKGKPAAYGAAAASAAARSDTGKKISLGVPSDGAGGVTPARKPRVVTGTGSAGKRNVCAAVLAMRMCVRG